MEEEPTPTDPAEIYASENHIDIELAQLTLADISQYNGSPHSGLLSCMKTLFIDSLSQLPAELTFIEKEAFELLTGKNRITPHQKIALINTLFLVASKEVQTIITRPWLLTYLLHANPNFDEDLRCKLIANLDIANDGLWLHITTEDLIEELEERECMIAKLAEQFRIGTTITCAAASYCSFDDAAKVSNDRRDHRSLQEAKKSQYNNNLPYNRYHQHLLIEIDPRRPRKEINQQIKTILDDIQQGIREEDQTNDGPLIIEWEIKKKQVKTALAAYLLIKTFGWRQEYRDSNDAMRKTRGKYVCEYGKNDYWRDLVKKLRKIEILFAIPDDENYIDKFIHELNFNSHFAENMKKWMQRHLKHAENLLNAARNQEKISTLRLVNKSNSKKNPETKCPPQ